ncbi:MAG: hypothetical protein PHF21_03640, partial [Bacilli bacterium]|nr:hypothetical protein [Bacilli bacterium]
KAIENAKYISTMQESKFNENFGINFIDGVNQILKKLYDHIMTINLLPETKKTLIDNFNNISTFSNEYKAAISKQNANKRLYENAMKALGISKSKQVTKDVSNKQEKNIDPLEQEVLKEKDVEEKEIEPEVILSDIIKLKDSKKHQFKGNLSGLTPNKNYKVIDVVLHDGITHYKLEGMGNNLYNSMDFDEVEKEEELKHDDKLISNDNSVVEIPEEKSLEESVGIISDLNKPAVPGKKVIAQTERLGKGSIAARLIAVTYVTGAILVPAVGPIALIPGLAYAYKEYQSYKKHKENNNEKTIIQRQKSAIQDSFTFLKRKMTDKLFSKATTPEDKQELEEMSVVIDEQIKNDQETKKEENTFSEIVSTGDPVLDEVLEAAQTEMAEEGLSKEELFDKALENLTNTPITEEPKMGGR